MARNSKQTQSGHSLIEHIRAVFGNDVAKSKKISMCEITEHGHNIVLLKRVIADINPLMFRLQFPVDSYAIESD